jgi:hypothetical protein
MGQIANVHSIYQHAQGGIPAIWCSAVWKCFTIRHARQCIRETFVEIFRYANHVHAVGRLFFAFAGTN